MKGVALNLTHSPEKYGCWERADPFLLGAGQAVSATETSTEPTPGVADSIEPHNGRQVTRRATNKEPLGNQPQWKYPSILPNVKRVQEMAASRVIGTGEPQGRSEEAANPR